MTKEEYRELNGYLNEAFMYLEYDCKFFLDNIKFLSILNDNCYQLLNEYKLGQESKENKLTYSDVCKLARNIISSINPNYLDKFDKLIDDLTIQMFFH